MSMGTSIVLTTVDWFALLTHFCTLSLLAVGGAIPMAPDMHRFLVGQHGWLTDAQFTSSVTLAQAAPGPNVLFVALLGWNVGLNAGGYPTAVLGMGITMLGILAPSSALMLLSVRWSRRNQAMRGVRAFKQGLAPLVVALMVATGWLLSASNDDAKRDWKLWLLAGVACIVVLRTRLHLLWLLGAGAVLGALGWV